MQGSIMDPLNPTLFSQILSHLNYNVSLLANSSKTTTVQAVGINNHII